MIREWLVPITETAVGIIDAMALVVIMIGTVEAFVAAMRGLFRKHTGHERRMVDVAEVPADEQLLAHGAEHGLGRIRFGHDGGPASTEDARLLSSDRFPIGAKVVDMVDAHTGQHRAIRVDDVHGVKPPAEADLEHECFYFLPGEEP